MDNGSNCLNILKITDYQPGVVDEIDCGVGKSWNVTFEHYETTLEMQMLNRYTRNQLFR